MIPTLFVIFAVSIILVYTKTFANKIISKTLDGINSFDF